MSADADQALWRAALDGDVSAVLHALGEHKLLRCVGGKEYSPAQSVGGTSELKRSFGGIEKHQHSELHGDEPPEVVHTKMSESILASNGSRLHNTIRTFVHDEHPTGAIQFQHLRAYNSRLAKENGDALLSSHRQPYKRWDELCYELDDTSIEGRFVYTRNYVYPGKNGQTALHVTKVTKIMELLMEYGWDPNYPDLDGNTPVHLHIGHDEELEVIIGPTGEEILQHLGPKPGVLEVQCVDAHNLQKGWGEKLEPYVEMKAAWIDVPERCKPARNMERPQWSVDAHDAIFRFPISEGDIKKGRNVDDADLIVYNDANFEDTEYACSGNLIMSRFTNARAGTYEWQRVDIPVYRSSGHSVGSITLKMRFVRDDGGKVRWKPPSDELFIPECLLMYGADPHAKNCKGQTPEEYYGNVEADQAVKQRQQEWTKQYEKWISNKDKYDVPDARLAVHRGDIPKSQRRKARNKK
jgi:hypothetical protein